MKKKLFLVLLLFIIGIYAISYVQKSFQNDTFFTIAIGERIQKYGIEQEEKLVWHEGLEYTNSRWLYDLIISIIYDKSGFLGISIFVCIFSAIIAVEYFLILKNTIKNTTISILATFLIVPLIRNIFVGRSLLISFILFLFEFYCLEKFKNTKVKPRYIVYLIILPFILVNIHASVFPVYFIIYLPYVFEWIIYRILKKINLKNESKFVICEEPNIKWIIALFVIGIFAGICTPPGMSPYTDMFKVTSGISSTAISELREASLISDVGLTFFILMFIAIIGFTKTKISFTDFSFIVGFTLMSLAAYRCIYFFYLIATICIFRLTIEFIREYNVKIEIDNQKKYFVFLNFIIILLVVIISASKILLNMNDNYVSSTEYPIYASEYILDNLNIENIRIYNHFDFGSYLEFKGIHAFIDSRSGVFTPEFNPGTEVFLDFEKTSVYGTKSYKSTFDKYNITHAILYNNELINLYIINDPEWKQIYKDDDFSIYERENSLE